MAISSVLESNTVLSTADIGSASRAESTKNISSSENDPAVILQISEHAREIVSKAGWQTPNALDPANFSIWVDPYYFLKPEYAAELRKLYEVIPTVQYLQPQLKPPYFRDAYDYNSEIARKEAEKIVAEAEKKGITLNFDVAFDHFKKLNSIIEPLPKGIAIYEGSAVTSSLDILSDSEKAMLEQMHNYAVEHGLPTNQLLEIAIDIADKKHWSYILGDKDLKSKGPKNIDYLTKDYLTDLAAKVKDGYEARRFNFAVLDELLKNFDEFEQAAKDGTASGRA